MGAAWGEERAGGGEDRSARSAMAEAWRGRFEPVWPGGTSRRLQSGRVVDEIPWQAEAAGDLGGEGADAEGLGRVVAGVEDVQSQVVGEGGGPVGAFAGDEGVEAGFGGLAQFGAGTAGDHTDGAADLGASREEDGGGTGRLGETGAEGLAIEAAFASEADRLALGFEEWLRGGQADGAGELDGIAEARVGVEGQVGTVHGEVVVQETAQELVVGARPGLGCGPEKPVVDDEKVGPGFDCEVDGGTAGVDGGGQAGDTTGILDLEAIDGAGPVGEGVRSEGPVAEADQGVEGCGGHGG